MSDERFGAVDGVDDPAEAAGAGLVAELFAQEPVGGERGGNRVADEPLGRLVRDRDRAVVGLVLDLECGFVVGAGEVAGLMGRAHGEIVAGAPVGVHATPTAAASGRAFA